MEALSLISAALTRVVFMALLFFTSHPWPRTEAAKPAQELVKGFEAIPDSTVDSFQTLLADPDGNFSFGFLRVNRTRLSLAVIHRNLSDPVWVSDPTRSASWSGKTRLFFNGSLVITDRSSRVEWSTGTDGDRVVLRNDSNLQVEKTKPSQTVVWQSFDFPSNTLVENQNFTSAMTLVSPNGLYSMRLGNDFIGLYADDSHQMYWKHKALEAKAKIEDGSGPVHIRINPNGYLGMYQRGNTPVDVEAFNSFQRPTTGLLILRLEPDGNLRGYLWDGSQWALNYQAISDTCELPNPCGPYSLCTPGSGCSCIDKQTRPGPGFGGCTHSTQDQSDLCDGAPARFTVLRRNGVEVPFKELREHKTASSSEECEAFCEEKCECWGSVYNNGSGFCYLVNYPIHTMLGVADEGKVGYFKLREGVGKGKRWEVGSTVGIAFVCGTVLVLTVAMGFVGLRVWRRERRVSRILEEDGGLSPGPYKDLGSDSFNSIEMSRR
ncbi:PREDICTED: PAN domain-containing protein At5g03700 [Tarenaya hassleriana]|uniref:PAN domain-containing protein At5g03700 n=1 Tax=Tarenaya hassleriana TaxID=28532 RepID=UPI00053C38AD|nr:PREDICTED: PAN domain-containing protein At5g03700 [Tarenaya hassleriana]